jgi:hypothetical protein
MEELFVPYEIAIKLKEKGFDKKCFMWWYSPNQISDDLIFRQYKRDKDFCEAPVYQQVIDWFIENHKILIQPQPNSNEHKVIGWGFGILKESTLPNINQAIEKALKLI